MRTKKGWSELARDPGPFSSARNDKWLCVIFYEAVTRTCEDTRVRGPAGEFRLWKLIAEITRSRIGRCYASLSARRSIYTWFFYVFLPSTLWGKREKRYISSVIHYSTKMLQKFILICLLLVLAPGFNTILVDKLIRQIIKFIYFGSLLYAPRC